MLDKIKNLLKHDSFLCVAGVIVVVLVVWGVGCESTVISPITGRKVSRVELDAERAMLLKNIESSIMELDKQDLFKQQLVDLGLVLSTGGSVNPAGLITSAVGLLGLGSVIDNRRKDSLIKMLKNNINTPEKVVV